MSRTVAIDAGPLVALIDRSAREHESVRERVSGLPGPMLTVEPAVTEAAYLVRRVPGGSAALLEMFKRGVLNVPFRLQDEAATVESLMRKYSNVPMSLADACLVRLLELTPKARLFTFDSDFKIYRLHGRRPIPLLD